MSATSRHRALIIDDETAVGATVARVARSCGYDAIVTDDPDDFLAKAANWKPSVVIVDLVMPGVDGLELVRRLGGQKASVRVLLVSGFDFRALEAAQRLGECYGLDMVGIVRKPFRVEELSSALDALASADPASTVRMKEALGSGCFRLVYQPKYDLATLRVAGVEALLRWDDPERGAIPPSVFVPAAEESGLIAELTRWAIDSALAQQAAWNRRRIAVDVAINLSLADLEGADLPDWFAHACRRHGVDASSITFEVTESMAMRDATAVTETLTRLRLGGAKIAIDDFGTGYSSLVQLRRLPFSELKIDRSFVADCTQSRESGAIVRAVVDLAHNLGLTTVGEGAESQEHVEALRVMGCDLVQGYALSPPVEADRIPELLARAEAGAIDSAARKG